MARLAREGQTDPVVRQTAARIVGPWGARDPECALTLLRAWLAGVLVFTRDPPNVELVRGAARQLAQWRERGYITGDCDDVAVLGAALGRALGFPARFVVLGFFTPRAPFAHVYTELRAPGGQWTELDVTRTPWRMQPTRRMFWEV